MIAAGRPRLLVLFGSALALLFFLHLLGALTGVESALTRLLGAVERPLGAAAVAARASFTASFRPGALMAENASLRRERDGLLVQLAQLESVRDENAILRETLKFARRSVKPPIAAHVLADLPATGLHAITIDKGEADGVAVNQAVAVGDGILIGKVIEVKQATATVMLLTDTRSRVGAVIQGTERIQGVIQGERGLSLSMLLIPQDKEIRAGDLVVTSGIEPLMPKGLVIGRVQDVVAQERAPFKTATLVSPADFARLGAVTVVVP